MTKYINADKLIKDLRDNAAEHFNSTVNSIIIAQPSADVVEVVRCEGCIYNLGKLSDKYVKCENSLRADLTDNDFCSSGIRRESK